MKTVYVNDKPKGALVEAILTADDGDLVIYHVGQHCGGQHRQDARWAHDAGHGRLFTRRRDKETFEYLLVRTARGGDRK